MKNSPTRPKPNRLRKHQVLKPASRFRRLRTRPLDRKITVHREGDKLIVTVPVRYYHRNGRQMILANRAESATGSAQATIPNHALPDCQSQRIHGQEQLESGQFESLEDLANANKVDRSYVGRILQLALLAPDIVESILAEEAFADISLRDFRKGIPVSWDEQRQLRVPA